MIGQDDALACRSFDVEDVSRNTVGWGQFHYRARLRGDDSGHDTGEETL